MNGLDGVAKGLNLCTLSYWEKHRSKEQTTLEVQVDPNVEEAAVILDL
jgi:hypothetical protein